MHARLPRFFRETWKLATVILVHVARLYIIESQELLHLDMQLSLFNKAMSYALERQEWH